MDGFKHAQDALFSDDDVHLLCAAIGVPDATKAYLLARCPVSRDTCSPESEFELMEDMRLILGQFDTIHRPSPPAARRPASERSLRSQSVSKPGRSKSVISETTNVASTFSRVIF